MQRDGCLGLVKLDVAARRLGCHVETLRIRVRNGRLPAVRGAHGAYYVSEEALAALPPLDRRISSEAAPTPAERERSWELVEQQVTRSRRAARDETVSLLRMIRYNPDQDRRLYRRSALTAWSSPGSTPSRSRTN